MSPGSRTRRLPWLAVALGVAVFLVYRATRKSRGPVLHNRMFAANVWQGRFPYQSPPPYTRPVHAPYPPSYGILMGPLLLPDILIARVLWAVLQLVMLVVLWRWMRRWWRSLASGSDPPYWVPLLSLVLGSRFLLRDMAGGGGNLVFGVLVVLACLRPGEAPGEDRRSWTGCLLGLVLAAKPTPVLFLPWLWLRGRRRTLALAVLTAAALHASPILTLGADGWARAYERWIDGVLAYMAQQDVFAEPAYGFPLFSWMNQALRYAVARFLGSVPAAHVVDSPLFLQGLGLPIAATAWVYRTLAFLLVAAVMATLSRARRNPSPWVEASAFGLLVALTLLTSPITWKSYHVQLLPVFFLLLARARLAAPERLGLTIGLVCYYVFCVLLSGDLVGEKGQTLLESTYVVTLGAIWALFRCWRILWADSRSAGPGTAAQTEAQNPL